MPFQVTNYHSKKSLSKAIAAGKKVFLQSVPFSKEQLKQNAQASALSQDPPHTHQTPMPYHSYEIQGSNNKQAPFYLCTVILGVDCAIIKVE